MRGRFMIALVASIIVGLAVGAGAGAAQARLNGKSGGTTVAAVQPTQTSGSGSGQSNSSGQTGGQGGTLGTVDSVTASGFVLVAQSGRVQVSTNSETKVQKTTDVKVADLKVGDTVVATGELQADGTVAATMIEVGLLAGGRAGAGGLSGQFGQGNPAGQNQGSGPNQGSGQRGGQQATPQAGTPGAQAQRGTMLAGTIEAVSGDTVSVKTQAGASSKVKVSSATALQKMGEGNLQDIKAGQTVLVTGQIDSSGTSKATAIQIIPAGQVAAVR
ncbi:MAG: DUF5666 domain-containing protein [Dehalococcoidia bacterium]|nr:DUF5666 domain-containing protein [Dehalococcoidia bacterium]